MKLVEGFAVAAQRELVFGAAVEVLEGEQRQEAARDAPQVLDVERAPEIPAGVASAPRDGGLRPRRNPSSRRRA
jgi:hypothetical protein